MVAHCSLHAKATTDAQPQDGSAATSLHHGCNTCQLCLAMVVGGTFEMRSALPLPYTLLQVSNISFTSADLIQGFKPPIS